MTFVFNYFYYLSQNRHIRSFHKQLVICDKYLLACKPFFIIILSKQVLNALKLVLNCHKSLNIGSHKYFGHKKAEHLFQCSASFWLKVF
jgi:hypothetical protein